MDTIDEQLDAATAKVNELTAQLAEANAALEAVQAEKASLEAVNTELSDNLAATRDKLAAEMRWYDRYLDEGDVDRSANPTPGNKKGGLSNIRYPHTDLSTPG